jgi:diguanylate cyclase (GGDEF)-like protein
MMKDGEVSMLSAARQQVNTMDMFRNFYMNWRNYNTLVMHPVYSGIHLYGYLFTDLNLNDFNKAEILVNQFSSAIKMLGLLRENDEIQRQLMENLKILRDNNIALDTLSNMDMLTGLYNRRGFFNNANDLLEDCRSEGINVIAMYADMNNLKIINDKYGHEEGDYALSLIGKVLKLVAGKNGVCGRIGGDEYALVIPIMNDESGEAISDLIDQKLDDANKKSNKAFDVTVSCGYQVVYANLDQDLEAALAVADAMLYEVKKRKKEAMKDKGI